MLAPLGILPAVQERQAEGSPYIQVVDETGQARCPLYRGGKPKARRTFTKESR
jgi:hypothetical protein